MKRRMVRSKIDPTMFGYIVKWVSDEVFIVSVHGEERYAAKEYWEEY